MMRVALCFAHFGPYHLARLKACRELSEMEVTGVQLAREQSEYPWGGNGNAVESVIPDRPLEAIRAGDWSQPVNALLERLNPDVCAIAGYSHPGMLAMLDWANRHGKPAVLMSDSTQHDEPRRWWKEALKRRLLRRYSAALVAGSRHREYLQQLHFRAPVTLGYDVVDNEHFAKAPISDPQLSTLNSQPYFLASARFIPKKNLPLLLRAYAEYRDGVAKAETTKAESGKQKAESGQEADAQLSTFNFQLSAFPPWPLVLLGDGPLRETLNSQLSTLNLHGHVLLPGFIQYDELPAWYARAGAFVHASTSEQWGLVVNEAMAAGLPVLVSERCGCVPELVQEGVNGFAFHPANESALSGLMARISQLPETARHEMGRASQRIVQEWGPERFARGLRESAQNARRASVPSIGFLDALLLRGLLRR